MTVVLRGAAAMLGFFIGGRVELTARPRCVTGNPDMSTRARALFTAQLDEFSVSASDTTRFLPFESLDVKGRDVQFGWKLPALLLAPAWLLLARRFIPILCCLLLVFPGGPKGELMFDAVIQERHLSHGAWPSVLSTVLSAISRASLPALLLELSDSDTAMSGQSKIPTSQCVGASVAGSKLVLDGRVLVQGRTEAYTLRTGVAARQITVDDDGTPLTKPHHVLCCEEPELRLSLGETGLAGMLPKMWMPVLSATGVRLPPAIKLRRATISEAAGGLVVDGIINLDGEASRWPQTSSNDRASAARWNTELDGSAGSMALRRLRDASGKN